MRIAGEFTAMGKRVPTQAVATTKHYGMLVQTQARANASGRPGPRAITGAYRRSITLRMKIAATVVEASIGSAAPQAARLELGFVGRDSLGRQYAQPPFIHLQPAVDRYADEYVRAIESKVHL